MLKEKNQKTQKFMIIRSCWLQDLTVLEFLNVLEPSNFWFSCLVVNFDYRKIGAVKKYDVRLCDKFDVYLRTLSINNMASHPKTNLILDNCVTQNIHSVIPLSLRELSQLFVGFIQSKLSQTNIY